MNKNFLPVIFLQLSERARMRGGIPLWLEYPVDPLSAPYLVTSPQALTWVDHASSEGAIRAAIRKNLPNLATLSMEMLQAILEMGTECVWGNCAGFDHAGICKVIDHVRSYGLGNLELLVHAASAPEVPASLPPMVTVVKVGWLPTGVAVAVPADRNYVGFASFVGSEKNMLGVVHNPSRGVGIATDLMVL